MFTDEYYMQIAVDLAKSTPLQTLPNPQVAAIIVKGGAVVGIGCHLHTGNHHAEIYALEQAGKEAFGATLFVNLEPCTHYGKTPPCTQAIINAGIKRVVIATLDPNPLVAGKGVNIMEASGIKVEVGLLAKQAVAINQVFFHNICYQEPFVTLKVGMSIDGKIATKNHISKWITSPESRYDAHLYRAGHSAILVGLNTVITDDPSLTPHLLENPTHRPIRIILDHQLRTPLAAKVVNDQAASTWICTTNNDEILQQKYLDRGIKIISLANLEVLTVLKRLYMEGIYSIMLEGGERIYASFIEARRVNQLITYVSPQLIGSAKASHFFAGAGFSDLETNPHFEIIEVLRLGNDVKIIYRLEVKS